MLWTFGGGDVIMNVVMSECCPLDWKGSLLVLLHKDGYVEQVGNYRGSVCKSIGKRLGRFVKDRILTEVQGGFRSDWECYLVGAGRCM